MGQSAAFSRTRFDAGLRFSLTAKVGACLFALFCLCATGAWLVLNRTLRPEFEVSEAREQMRDIRRVAAALSSLSHELSARAGDYGKWDDTYAFMRGRDPGFPARQFDAQWFEYYNVDLVLFIDTQGRIKWGRDRTRERTRIEASPFAFNIALNELRGRAGHLAQSFQGALWLPHGPVLYAAHPITRSDGSGAPLGTLVIGRIVSAEVLGWQTQTRLELVGAGEARRGARLQDGLRRLAPPGAASEAWCDESALHALVPLRSIDGRLIGAVHLHADRTIAAFGAWTIAQSFLIVAGELGCALAGAGCLFYGLAFRRIARLERAMRAARPDVFPHQPPMKDELARMRRAWELLVHRDREAQACTGAVQVGAEFFSQVSFEMRTPLNAIFGYSELAEEEARTSGNGRASADLARIRAAAQRLMRVVSDMSDLARAQGGMLKPRAVEFSVLALLRGAVETAEPEGRDNPHPLSLSAPNDLGWAKTDEKLLRRCLSLALIAAKDCAREGELTVRARRDAAGEEERLHFEIRDERGALAGLTLDDAAGGGTGALGLELAKKLAELLGGVLRLKDGALILDTPARAAFGDEAGWSGVPGIGRAA